MKKNLIMFFLVFFVSSFLTGCVTPALSDYQIWKDSADAEDLNGDRKINELDYQLFLEPPLSDYEAWRNSEASEDLNGDRKINETDYALFLNPPPSAYEVWSESTDAEDFNGDTIINETDYELFLNPPPSAYEVWHDSDDAEDLNDDRRINETDYELFINPPPTAYELWSESEDANDLNGDTLVNEVDYELFLGFVGDYRIVNYSYVGENIHHYLSGIEMTEYGPYLNEMLLTCDSSGSVGVNIPSTTIELLGADFALIVEAIDNSTLTFISPLIMTLDTSVTFDTIVFNFTLYFTNIENGFTTTYQIEYGEFAATISFDIIKE